MNVLCFALIVASLALPASAETKPPWEWTLDERLADRFDPAKIRERHEAYVASYPQLKSMPEHPLSANEIRYGIQGSRNPELFLPHELFDFLLRSGLNTDAGRRARGRASIAAGLKKSGFDPDSFWSGLESVSAAYLGIRDRQNGTPAESFEKCHSRFEALNAARELFGRERFDRMLYTVVAPKSDFGAGTTFPDPASPLRREANGCE